MASDLANLGCDVTYLNSKYVDVPYISNVEIWQHDGFKDYRKKVLTSAHEFDAIVLGAAVANLLPEQPFERKFPSHRYNVGDVVPINFKIAPRIIDEASAKNKTFWI